MAGAMIAKFRNGGQACTAANRFFVHADVVDDFLAPFGARSSAPGRPWTGTASAADQRRGRRGVAALVDDAVAAGAEVLSRRPCRTGWFYPPTLLAGVAPDVQILREEIFGPVAPSSSADEATMLRMVNDTELGLAAYVYAGRLQRALRIAEAIDAGMVGVNRGFVSDPAAPFGGVKQSGMGREGARDGIREYQETRYFSVSLVE